MQSLIFWVPSKLNFINMLTKVLKYPLQMVNSDRYLKATIDDKDFLSLHEILRLSNTFYKCYQGEGELYEKNMDELEILGYNNK